MIPKSETDPRFTVDEQDFPIQFVGKKNDFFSMHLADNFYRGINRAIVVPQFIRREKVLCREIATLATVTSRRPVAELLEGLHRETFVESGIEELDAFIRQHGDCIVGEVEILATALCCGEGKQAYVPCAYRRRGDERWSLGIKFSSCGIDKRFAKILLLRRQR